MGYRSPKSKNNNAVKTVFISSFITGSVSSRYRRQFEENMNIWDKEWRSKTTYPEAILEIQLRSAIEKVKRKTKK